MRKNDNRGLSLVELLVALAVSAIVMTGVASLIFSSLRLYGVNNANVEIQNESQMVLNLVLDTIMEAKGICMQIPKDSAGDEDTECILLGDFEVGQSATAGQYQALFAGTAVVFIEKDAGENPVQEMYLVELQEAGFPELQDGYCVLAKNQSSKEEAATAALERAREFVYDMEEEDRLPWLMGRYVSSCVIRPADGMTNLPEETVEYVNGSSEVKYYFVEPFTLRVNLGFEYKQQNRSITRNLEDEVAVRSRLKQIYVEEESGRGMIEYKRR